VPDYALFGECDAPQASIHIEPLAARAPFNDWHIPMHRHPALLQFLLISRGQLDVHLDGHRRRLCAPALIGIPAGRAHGFAFQPWCEGYVISVRDQRSGADPPGHPLSVAFPSQPLAECCEPAAIEVGPRLLALQTRPGKGAQAMRRALLAEVAAHAQLLCEQHRLDEPAPAGHRLLHRFQAQIEHRLGERWSVARHAQALSVSAAHLNRVVRALDGTTASTLIAQATLRRAQTLLLHSDRNIAEIAFLLGFDDPPHFSRRFRTLSGHSPSAWRRAASQA